MALRALLKQKKYKNNPELLKQDIDLIKKECAYWKKKLEKSLPIIKPPFMINRKKPLTVSLMIPFSRCEALPDIFITPTYLIEGAKVTLLSV